MYNAYIVEVKEIREHSNADRLNIARIFDCNVIVDKSVQIGDKGENKDLHFISLYLNT